MENRIGQLTVRDQLLQARKENLEHVQELNSIQAHGKVLGMDAFSWTNPDMHMLVNWIASVPFEVIWLGPHTHVQEVVSMNHTVLEKIESLILHDGFRLHLSSEELERIKNITCVGDITGSLELIKAFRQDKRMLLFTAESEAETKLYKKFITAF